MNTTTHHAPKPITYNNNPFLLAFSEFGKAFKINQNPAIFVLAGGLILGVANQLLSYVPDIVSIFVDDTGVGSTVFLAMFTTSYLVISGLVGVFMNGFLSNLGVVNAKGNSITLKAALRITLSKYFPLLGISIIVSLVTALFFLPAVFALIGGGILLANDYDQASIGVFTLALLLAVGAVVMAIRFGVARMLSIYAMFDEKSGVFASMRRSVELTKGRLIETWGMSFVSIIPVIGSFLAGVGLGGHYLQLKVYKSHGAELPKTHFISWIPLILLLLVVPLIAIALIILAALFVDTYR